HRQVLATLALVAFTVAPTAYVSWAVWRVNQPGHVREVEAEAGRRIGLHVALDSVRYPRPGEAVLRGVTLRREDGPSRLTEVARATVVRVRLDGRDATLEAEGLLLRGEGPKAALAQAAALLGRAAGPEVDRVSLSAAEARVELGSGLAF